MNTLSIMIDETGNFNMDHYYIGHFLYHNKDVIIEKTDCYEYVVVDFRIKRNTQNRGVRDK